MNIGLILREKYPEAEWQLVGESYDGLLWYSDTEKPTEQELKALWVEVEANENVRLASLDTATAKLKKLGLNDDEISALVNGA